MNGGIIPHIAEDVARTLPTHRPQNCKRDVPLERFLCAELASFNCYGQSGFLPVGAPEGPEPFFTDRVRVYRNKQVEAVQVWHTSTNGVELRTKHLRVPNLKEKVGHDESARRSQSVAVKVVAT